jgi:hypothetical protein
MHNHDSHEKFNLLIGPIREEAKRLGYAIGVHGSLIRDIDLIACPWTLEAVSAKELAIALSETIKLYNNGVCYQLPHESWDDFYFAEGCLGMKPWGRLCWVYHLDYEGAYIDLSVMAKGSRWEPEYGIST